MVTADPKDWQPHVPDTRTYRVSPFQALRSLAPLAGLLLAGSVLQYVLQGFLSPGMEWVIGGTVVFAIASAVILPRVNRLELTADHLTIRELTSCRRVAWGDIEPGSVGYVVRTAFLVPLFTTVGFRVIPGSQHRTGLGAMGGVVTGMHVSFMNMYPIRSDDLVTTLRAYQARHGEPAPPAG